MNSTKKDGLSQEGAKDIKEMSKDVIFSPTAMMERIKAKFWTNFVPGPFNDKDNLSAVDVASVVKSAKINEWWSLPGFVDWFMNRQEEKEKLKYLFNKSLSTLERILDNPEVNANAQVNAIKILAEMNGFLIKGGNLQQKFADDHLNQMTAKELEAMLEKQALDYIKAKGLKLVEEKVIDIDKSKTDE